MMKKALVALAISGMTLSAQAGDVMLTEGFDNVFGLESKGWVMNNASNPLGVTGWYQGDVDKFEAQAGAANSYAAANFGNATSGGIINNWLISPTFQTTWGNTVSFWLRGDLDADYTDQLAFGVSQGGSAFTDFVMNPAITATQGAWTEYTFTIDAREGMGRLAFQYTGEADLSNYIGLDSLVVSDIPEPSTMAILFAGAMGLAMSRRRKRG